MESSVRPLKESREGEPNKIAGKKRRTFYLLILASIRRDSSAKKVRTDQKPRVIWIRIGVEGTVNPTLRPNSVQTGRSFDLIRIPQSHLSRWATMLTDLGKRQNSKESGIINFIEGSSHTILKL